MDIAVTIFALNRVLSRLSEDEQSRQPGYDAGNFQARAQARVIVKQLFRLSEASVRAHWQARKDAE